LIVIIKDMRLRLLKSLITYVILLLYVLTPIFDSMVCAGCMDNPPFQCETTSGNLRTSHDDVIYTSYDGTQSKTPAPGEHAAKSFCSICANILTGNEVFSPNVYISVAQWDGPCATPALSELYNSINKPPQNLLV
jgi:hypothetical protein